MAEQTLVTGTEMAYGFDSPRKGRTYNRPPQDELHKAFEKWLDETGEYISKSDRTEEIYRMALGTVNKEILGGKSVQEINSLVLDFLDWDLDEAGLFLSACYNTAEMKDVVFDVATDKSIGYIGYKFRGKRLVNRSVVGFRFGMKSEAVVINDGDTESQLGCESEFVINNKNASQLAGSAVKKVFINTGRCGDSSGENSKYITINVGTFGDYSALSSIGLVVNAGIAGKGFAHNTGGIIIAVKAPKRYGYLRYAEKVLRPRSKDYTHFKKYLEDLKDVSKKLGTVSLDEFQYLFDVWFSDRAIEDAVNKDVTVFRPGF